MKPTNLERAVITWLLADGDLNPVRRDVDFTLVSVSSRDYTGAGFLTEFEKSEELKLYEDGVSLRWGKLGARLNAGRVETGYLVYVDDGYVTAVEGYTYGDEWPREVESIEWYGLKPGMELLTKPSL